MELKQAILSKSLAFLDNGSYSFDNRRLLHDADAHLQEAASRIWEKIKHTNPTVLVGKGVGAYPLLIAIKLFAGYADKRNLSVLFIRDSRKTRGVFRKLVEGPLPADVDGQKAAFIDDLYNKGSTYRECKQTIFDEGFNLQFVACAVIFDFWDQSRQLIATGEPFFSLFQRRDLGLTRKDNNLPTLLDTVKWRQHIFHEGVDQMPIKSKPVIWQDKLYMGNDNNNFYCLDVNTGDTIWVNNAVVHPVKGVVCEAQIDEAGFVYWPSYDGTLKKANAETGKLDWVVKLDAAVHSTPALDFKNDRLFIGTEWDKRGWYGVGDFVAVKMSTGVELWRTQSRGMIPASPVYDEKLNLIVCGSNDFHLYVLDASTGSVSAKIPVKGEVKGRAAIADNIAVAVTTSGWIYGIDLITFQVLWERRIGLSTVHSFAIIEDGLCFVTNAAMSVIAIELTTGNISWVTKLRGAVQWGVNDLGPCLLALTTNGYVVLLDKQTGRKLASDNISRSGITIATCYQPPAYNGKNLLIPTNRHGLICYDLDLSKVMS